MGRKKIHKAGVLNVRVPMRTRFGAELLSQKYGVALSAVVNRAIEQLLDAEGLSTRKKGEMFSLLDRLWDESEYLRLRNVQKLAPELLSGENRNVLDHMSRDVLEAPEATLDDLDDELTRVRKAFSES